MDARWIVAGGVVLLVVFFTLRKDAVALAGAAVDGVKAVGNAVNPVNHDNVFASGVNSVGGAITGESGFSLGGWLWDATHATPGTK